MKILGGSLKGRNFFMPQGVRPTQDLVRKALFDILGQELKGVSLIELFAGSGAVGLEAISRGAKEVIFVEKEPKFAHLLEDNLSLLNIKNYDNPTMAYRVFQDDAFKIIKNLGRQNAKFDIAFLDPPYGRELAKKSLKTLGEHDILHRNCLVIAQHDKHEILPETAGRFFRIREKKYGSSVLTFYEGH